MDIFKVRSPEEGALAQVVAVQRTPMEGWVFALCLYANLTYVGLSAVRSFPTSDYYACRLHLQQK